MAEKSEADRKIFFPLYLDFEYRFFLLLLFCDISCGMFLRDSTSS